MAPWVDGVAQLKDDPIIDKLYADFNGELDLAKRKAIFAEYQRYVYEQAVVMQLGNYGIIQVVSAKLQNYVPFRIPRMWGTWLA
jgi:peptide/nickel transport system substrate-binding protein